MPRGSRIRRARAPPSTELRPLYAICSPLSAGTTPVARRQTTLTEFVNDLDPKLTVVALGMNGTAMPRYAADNVARDRCRSFMATTRSAARRSTPSSPKRRSTSPGCFTVGLDVCARAQDGETRMGWSCAVNPRFRDGFGGGRMSVVDVELLVVPDCPNESGALSGLRLAFERMGLTAQSVRTTVIASQEQA